MASGQKAGDRPDPLHRESNPVTADKKIFRSKVFMRKARLFSQLNSTKINKTIMTLIIVITIANSFIPTRIGIPDFVRHKDKFCIQVSKQADELSPASFLTSVRFPFDDHYTWIESGMISYFRRIFLRSSYILYNSRHEYLRFDQKTHPSPGRNNCQE